MNTSRSALHWKQEWTGYVVLVLVLRLVYAGFGLLVVSRGGPIPLEESIYGLVKPFLAGGEFSRWFVNPWFQWDTISYLGIAILGYRPDASIAFMPLYPLLIRVTAPLMGGNHLLAALALSTAFCIVTLILMHELFADSGPADAARRTVLTFVSFPTAFFLLAGYTEALFMALVLAFWLSARRRRWLWASFFACLATLTRLQGVVLSVVLLWMILASMIRQPAQGLTGQIRQVIGLFFDNASRRSLLSNWAALAAVAGPVLVSAGYQAWLRWAGLGTIPEALRQFWRLETVLPWEGFVLFLQRIPAARFSYMDWVDLFLFIVILAASLIGLRRLDPAYSLYIWLTLAVLLMRGTPPHLLASYSRYFLALFPLASLPARMSNGTLRLAIFAFSCLLQVALVWIFLWGSWVA